MTRFAPSPTGRMHLGNMMTALLSWLSARSSGKRWILRIEDLDKQRSRREYAVLIEYDLRWLGLYCDEGGVYDKGPSAPYSQSRRGDLYAAAFEKLRATGLVYPCYCRRADLLAAGAPHQSDGRIVYSGRCRPEKMPLDAAEIAEDFPVKAAARLWVPDENISFEDKVAGKQSYNLARDCGDFIVRRADGGWAYQLAVVVDDAAMGISEVTRGNDLLLSTAQQIYLYRLLGLEPPRFAHVPLVCNKEGVRLSKRDAPLSMLELRWHYTPEKVTGWLAWLAGLIDRPEPVSPRELIGDFSWDKVRKTPTVSVDLLP